MDVRELAAGTGAGLATFLVVTVAVTELATPAVAFPVLVGLPVGVVAGFAVFVFVLTGLADDVAPDRRRVAVAAGSFGAVFVLVLVVEGVVLGTRPSIALPVATVVGLGFGLLAYLRA